MNIAKKLTSLDRNYVLNHLLSLSDDNKYLRFAYHINDEGIEKFVSKINFEDDGCFGVFNEDLNLIAFVHVVVSNKSADIALSVSEGNQGQGLGNILMDKGVKFAKSKGIENITMQCLYNNIKMLKIAKKYDLKIEYIGSERIGSLHNEELPIFASTEIFMMDQVAKFDYYAKLQNKVSKDICNNIKKVFKV